MTKWLKTDSSNLKEFEEASKNWRRYKLQDDIHPHSLSEVIYHMIIRQQPTFGPRGGYHCSGNRRRSIEDVFKVCKFYKDNITLTQVKKAVDRLTELYKISRSYCSVVRKFVHYPNSLTLSQLLVSEHLGELNIKFDNLKKL